MEKPNRPTVVIDTNVFISFFWGGHAVGRILKGFLAGEFYTAISDPLLQELRLVAIRPKFSKKIEPVLFEELFEAYRSASLWVTPKEKVFVSHDKKDNIFLECAAESKADYLVTGDNHLLDVGHYRGTNIVTPAMFVRMVLDRK